jgi:hypothetical protein
VLLRLSSISHGLVIADSGFAASLYKQRIPAQKRVFFMTRNRKMQINLADGYITKQ